MRGAHWVDPTGKPDLELAAKYKEKAEAVEEQGYHRFATSLMRMAESCERDAERIISEKEDLVNYFSGKNVVVNLKF